MSNEQESFEEFEQNKERVYKILEDLSELKKEQLSKSKHFFSLFIPPFFIFDDIFSIYYKQTKNTKIMTVGVNVLENQIRGIS